jgi:low affinity Fe/Cu permease
MQLSGSVFSHMTISMMIIETRFINKMILPESNIFIQKMKNSEVTAEKIQPNILPAEIPQNRVGFSLMFTRFSNWASKTTGSPVTFVLATLIIITWAVTGPIFKFSDTWQLVINTGTSVITFLMVFVIQQSQNRDTTAMHIKLNELIAANKNASNRVVGVENLTDQDLIKLKGFYDNMAELTRHHDDLFTSRSVDEKNKTADPDPTAS